VLTVVVLGRVWIVDVLELVTLERWREGVRAVTVGLVTLAAGYISYEALKAWSAARFGTGPAGIGPDAEDDAHATPASRLGTVFPSFRASWWSPRWSSPCCPVELGIHHAAHRSAGISDWPFRSGRRRWCATSSPACSHGRRCLRGEISRPALQGDGGEDFAALARLRLLGGQIYDPVPGSSAPCRISAVIG
jgi:hypothetical protein